MILETVQNFFLQVKDLISSYDWLSDTLDIIFVAVLIYGIVVSLRKSQSIQIIKGVLLVVIIYGIVNFFEMKTSTYIFSKLFSDIILIFVIVFSGEIRKALESVGKKNFGKTFSLFSSDTDETELEALNAICRACGVMSRNKVGSLIVFQRNSLLGDLTKGAVTIDSATTYEMVCSIFYPNAPLHDGAVVVKDGRIIAARCVVPLRNDREVIEGIGTRHRAAIEVSLNSDAVAVVTSEETGIISIAENGVLSRDLTESQLYEKLSHLLFGGKKNKNEKKNRAEKKNKKTAEKSDEDASESVETAADVPVDTGDYLSTPTTGQDFSNLLVNEGDENDEQE